tara:strand:+ start:1463 stop:1786 length:324 start_codon:yes stop_codon:yes gene_type:complete
MTWEDILKAHCSTEKTDEEKALVGNQKEIDSDGDGKITGKDFEQLRERKADPKPIIIRTLRKEGGAAGLDVLCEATGLSKNECKTVVDSMKNIKTHKDGDIILMDGL